MRDEGRKDAGTCARVCVLWFVCVSCVWGCVALKWTESAGKGRACTFGCLPPFRLLYPHHLLCGVDEMGKPAKDLVERVGGMGRPPGKIKTDTFQKRPILGPSAKLDVPI